MPTINIPGATKRNVYLFSDNHTEKRDTQLPDVEWVNDEIDAEEARATAAEATLQANITAEEARATAAEALKENLSNKIAATGTYVKDDTHYPTTALMEAKIAALSPKQVEWAEYEVTTFAQLKTWKTAGKVVLLLKEGGIYRMSFCNSSYAVFALVVYNGLTGTDPQSIEIRQYRVNNSGWSFIPDTKLEMSKNKLASTATWAIDDTKYPTTAAVEDRIAAIPSPANLEWATKDITTLAKLNEWNTAGKRVLCNYGGCIFVMDYCASDYASLTFVTWTSRSSGAIAGANIRSFVVDSNGWTRLTDAGIELTRNQLTSAMTWMSDNDHYATTKAIDYRIAALSPEQVEWAEYNVTTLAQLRAWHEAGKIVLLFRQASIYRMCYYNTAEARFSAIDWNGLSGTTPLGVMAHFYKVTSSGWTYIDDTRLELYSNKKSAYATWTDWDDNSYPTCQAVDDRFEKKGNKLGSTGSWIDDDTLFPTTKAVANYVAAHAGGAVYEIDVTGELKVYCDELYYTNSYYGWKVRLCGPAYGNEIGPGVFFTIKKNGKAIAFNSDLKLVIEPYVESGNMEYSSGQYVNAPTTSYFGQPNLSSNPDDANNKWFGIQCVIGQPGLVPPSRNFIKVKWNGMSASDDLRVLYPNSCYISLSLYDKNVSQTVPVAHKLIGIIPTLMSAGTPS